MKTITAIDDNTMNPRHLKKNLNVNDEYGSSCPASPAHFGFITSHGPWPWKLQCTGDVAEFECTTINNEYSLADQLLQHCAPRLHRLAQSVARLWRLRFPDACSFVRHVSRGVEIWMYTRDGEPFQCRKIFLSQNIWRAKTKPLRRLEVSFGIRGVALNWFASYLFGRS